MKALTQLLAQLGLFAALGSAYLQDPPTSADPSTVSDCSWWIIATSTDTCAAIAGANGISVSDFELVYNPSVGTECTLNAGQSYCVERNYGVPPVTSTSTSSAPASTTTGNGITTPTPTQPGMVSNCNKFDFVATGDSCSTVAARNGITVDQLSEWNSAGPDCTALWGKVYVCVGVIGTSTTSTTTSTTTGNGISTPTPTQPGMVSNCNKFDFVNTGDSCSVVATRNGITVDQLIEWNSAGPDCTSLWGKVYVCVGVIGTGTTTTTSSTTTTSGNGITTPTPTQPGMVSNCNKFDYVNKGDSCSVIATRNGITIANLIDWNNAGTDCTSLWAEVYVCVGVVGTSTTLSTSTTTTTTGNGVSTPTPTQPGMVPNCNKFDFANKGDSCSAIASRNGISVTDLILWNDAGTDCTSIWALVYVCVGVISSVFRNSTQVKYQWGK